MRERGQLKKLLRKKIGAEIHQALTSHFSPLAEFSLKKCQSKTKIVELVVSIRVFLSQFVRFRTVEYE